LNNMLRASTVAVTLLALVSIASAQVARESLIRPSGVQAPSRSSARVYVIAEGTKQGKFKGQSTGAKWQNAVPAVAYTYQVSAPTDAATGLPTGKRAHGPVVITMPAGAASPQFFTAVTENEVLKSVTLQFVRAEANGTEEVFYTVKLTNATASRFRQYTAAPDPANPAAAGLLIEVSFAFQKIEMTSADGGTMAIDDWGK
jgi:type VI secretion system secreted protein Hcp